MLIDINESYRTAELTHKVTGESLILRSELALFTRFDEEDVEVYKEYL